MSAGDLTPVQRIGDAALTEQVNELADEIADGIVYEFDPATAAALLREAAARVLLCGKPREGR